MIKPIGNRLLVERVAVQEEMKGGIYIPEAARESSQEGVVVALGTDKFNVAIGDKVILGRYAGIEVKFNGKTYNLVTEEEILGVISND